MSEPLIPEIFPGDHTKSEDPSDFINDLLSGLDISGEMETLSLAFADAMERADPGGEQAKRDELCRADLAHLSNVLDKDPTNPELPQIILAVLEEYDFVCRRKVEPSPLFPEGRVGSLSVREVLRRNSGIFPKGFEENIRSGHVSLPDRVLDYIETTEIVPHDEYVKPSSHVEFTPDPELYQRTYDDLRAEFGAKAAGLIVFDASIRGDTSLTHVIFGEEPILEVPPFIPVSKRLHALWQTDYPSFTEECEKVREQMLTLPYADSPLLRTWLVAIRSSAVKSEDGDAHSAAGIYHSGAVDVRDPDAFRVVIEQVFTSTTSENALLYQQEVGVENEEMGLIVQLYSEEFDTPHEAYEGIGINNGYYGHANYALRNRAVSVQIMDAGSLLYDTDTVGNLRFKPWPSYYDLHTDPDHNSFEYLAIKKVGAIPYAVALATYLFGKPMEVEFHNKKILQVRPYIDSSPEVDVEFSVGKRTLVSTRSVGIIDAVLPHLDGSGDNRGKTGYIIIEQEYCFTASGNYKGFPEKGAVFLLQPSDGHVQAYCREKGLACLFPQNYRGGDLILEAIQVGGDNSKHTKDNLHIVSDGFEARVYDGDEMFKK